MTQIARMNANFLASYFLHSHLFCKAVGLALHIPSFGGAWGGILTSYFLASDKKLRGLSSHVFIACNVS